MKQQEDSMAVQIGMTEVDRGHMKKLADQLVRSREIVQSTMPVKVDTKAAVLGKIKDSSQALSEAYALAMGANPLAADVPVFQKMQALAKEVSALMLEVNKLRGL